MLQWKNNKTRSDICENEENMYINSNFDYADELIPEQYKNFAPAKKYPIAFATIISKNPIQNLPSIEYSINKIHKNVYDFIKKHLTKCYTFTCKEGTYV